MTKEKVGGQHTQARHHLYFHQSKSPPHPHETQVLGSDCFAFAVDHQQLLLRFHHCEPDGATALKLGGSKLLSTQIGIDFD